jgi:hypothetical protein
VLRNVSGGESEEAPRVRDALELMLAAILESKARARDEILHRAGDQYLAGGRK